MYGRMLCAAVQIISNNRTSFHPPMGFAIQTNRSATHKKEKRNNIIAGIGLSIHSQYKRENRICTQAADTPEAKMRWHCGDSHARHRSEARPIPACQTAFAILLFLSRGARLPRDGLSLGFSSLGTKIKCSCNSPANSRAAALRKSPPKELPDLPFAAAPSQTPESSNMTMRLQ
eukprot:TRINITY_DN50750_c0_g1_i1.p1 TRINITY_DN50750_c0_g1~~TRINITY_DN50750_c0_g1_i1.p1  ORF type:complete len:174 (+),score=12.73 TRINITY_DN50750_c0_g1_i1:127-648(+)